MRWSLECPSPADAAWSLSNDGRTASACGNYGAIWGTSQKAWGSGKWYIELSFDAVSSIAGLGNSALGLTSGMYQAGCSPTCTCCSGERPAFGSGWSDGDIIGVALDLTSTAETPDGSVEYYRNGVGQGVLARSGTYDAPLSSSIDLTSGQWTMFVADHTGGSNCNTATILAQATYPIPEGFLWWG